MRRIWIGDEGVRSGWRLLTFLVLQAIAMVVGVVGSMLLVVLLPSAMMGIGGALAVTVPLTLASAVAAVVTGLSFDRTLVASGLGGPLLRTLAEWIGGALLGAAALTASWVLVVGASLIGGSVTVQWDGAGWWWIPLFVPGWISAAAMEELWMRGVGFVWAGRMLGNGLVAGRGALGLAASWDPWLTWIGRSPVTLLSAVLFGLMHMPNPGDGMLSLLNTVLAGLWLSTAVYRTRSLHVAIAAHASWNAVMGMGFGVAVSGIGGIPSLARTHLHGPDWLTGGDYGLEGSLLTTFVLIAFTGLTALLPRRPDATSMSALRSRPRPTEA